MLLVREDSYVTKNAKSAALILRNCIVTPKYSISLNNDTFVFANKNCKTFSELNYAIYRLLEINHWCLGGEYRRLASVGFSKAVANKWNVGPPLPQSKTNGIHNTPNWAGRSGQH